MVEDTVRVAIRVRPLVSTEIDRGCQSSINVISHENQIQIIGTDKAFTFNHVFEPTTVHEKFYDEAVKEMIPNIFKGYNVTILAYGQTGSGKTYTMGTNYMGDENWGVIPRAVHDIFTTIKKNENWKYKISVSFVELYKEQLYDLLATDKQRKDCIVDIREENREIKIVGVTEKEVTNANDALQMLLQGSQGRATGATAMNNLSSRSHAIFTIIVHQEKKEDSTSATSAKFHLVDLAGSERSKKTGATGERFKEGVNINLGLFALGNVISQLGEGGANTFITYRDSKLTRLLQDSLGGNSMTLMIACISPADYNLDETLSTLRYADRARKIKNKPIVNQDPHRAEINRLQAVVKELKSALLCQGAIFACPPEHTKLLEENRKLTKKMRQLMEKLNTSLINTICMNERSELAETAKEKLCTGLTSLLDEFSTFLQNDNLAEDPHTILKDIYDRILELVQHQKKIDSEINSHMSFPQILSHTEKANDSSSPEQINDYFDNTEALNTTADLDEKHAEHTLRQVERENEVQTINCALALKEELISKLLCNTSQFSEQTREIQDMENEIKTLQAEKEQFLKTIENVQATNTSAKLAESRRKKVQELEKKILELTKKCIEQSRVIKSKEKSDIQLKHLRTEIQSLKRTRVKLVREMRKEAENFSHYKSMRERELYKLKDQDRKRQNQIVRMQTQHNKQQNVSKRKMEEACTVIKRLKEALEKQRQTQMRSKSQVSQEEVKALISQEISILSSTVDAKSSLEKLIKERAALATVLGTLQQRHKENPSTELNEQIMDFTDYIELRNVQISELRQKINEAVDEYRTNSRVKTMQSLFDAKMAIEMLLDTYAENKTKYNIKCSEYDELMDKHNQILRILREYELKENARQDVGKNPKILEIPEINVTDTDEIAKLKHEIEILNHQAKKVINPLYSQIIEDQSHETDFIDDSIVADDGVKNYPDCRKTPLHKRSHSVMVKSITITSNENTVSKRNSDGEVKCSCRTKCTSRVCSCHKTITLCGSGCGCNPEICENRDKNNVSRPYFNETNQLESQINYNKRARTDLTG